MSKRLLVGGSLTVVVVVTLLSGAHWADSRTPYITTAFGSDCEDFIGQDAGPGWGPVVLDTNGVPNARIQLARRVHFEDKLNKRWIGAVQLVDTKEVSPTYDELVKFGDIVCFRFTKKDSDPEHSTAKRMKKQGGGGRDMVGMFCSHLGLPHSPEVQAEWTWIPETCPRFYVTVRVPSGRLVTAVASLKGLDREARRGAIVEAIRVNANKDGPPVSDEFVKGIMDRIGKDGPWFPCQSAGCCRPY